jgi:hypothetical protein
MIPYDARREGPIELQPAMAVWRAHHGNLGALLAKSIDTAGPFPFHRGHWTERDTGLPVSAPPMLPPLPASIPKH